MHFARRQITCSMRSALSSIFYYYYYRILALQHITHSTNGSGTAHSCVSHIYTICKTVEENNFRSEHDIATLAWRRIQFTTEYYFIIYPWGRGGGRRVEGMSETVDMLLPTSE